MKQEAINTFSEGLVMDLNPLTTPNNVLTSALNATMLTYDGNEFVLQNDMGNGRVETAYLPSGYVPVGIKEFGGIIYVASYNPITNKGQIGSFPSPERNISSNEIQGAQTLLTPASFGSISGGVLDTFVTKIRIFPEGTIIRSGDKFTIMFDGSKGSQVNTQILKTYLSGCFNTTNGKPSSPKNKLMTLTLTVSDSNGYLRDITSQLKRFDKDNRTITFNESDAPLYKTNVGYYIQTATKDYSSNVDEYRKTYPANVYNNKLSGELILVASLNMVDSIDVSVTGYVKPDDVPEGANYQVPNDLGISIPSGSKYALMYDLKYKYNCPDGYFGSEKPSNYDSVLKVYNSYYGNASDFGSFSNAIQGCEFNITDSTKAVVQGHVNFSDNNKAPVYNLSTEQYSRDQSVQVNLAGSSGNLINYTVTPCMTYSRLQGLAASSTIDLSKIGSGTTEINVWKYYYNDTSMILTWGMESYPVDGTSISQVAFRFYKYPDAVKGSPTAEYIVPSKRNYNGIFTDVLRFGDVLEANNIYLVEIQKTIKKGDVEEIDDKLEYRWLVSSPLYNEAYLQDERDYNNFTDEVIKKYNSIEVTPKTSNSFVRQIGTLVRDPKAEMQPSTTKYPTYSEFNIKAATLHTFEYTMTTDYTLSTDTKYPFDINSDAISTNYTCNEPAKTKHKDYISVGNRPVPDEFLVNTNFEKIANVEPNIMYNTHKYNIKCAGNKITVVGATMSQFLSGVNSKPKTVNYTNIYRSFCHDMSKVFGRAIEKQGNSYYSNLEFGIHVYSSGRTRRAFIDTMVRSGSNKNITPSTTSTEFFHDRTKGTQRDFKDYWDHLMAAINSACGGYPPCVVFGSISECNNQGYKYPGKSDASRMGGLVSSQNLASFQMLLWYTGTTYSWVRDFSYRNPSQTGGTNKFIDNEMTNIVYNTYKNVFIQTEDSAIQSFWTYDSSDYVYNPDVTITLENTIKCESTIDTATVLQIGTAPVNTATISAFLNGFGLEDKDRYTTLMKFYIKPTAESDPYLEINGTSKYKVTNDFILDTNMTAFSMDGVFSRLDGYASSASVSTNIGAIDLDGTFYDTDSSNNNFVAGRIYYKEDDGTIVPVEASPVGTALTKGLKYKNGTLLANSIDGTTKDFGCFRDSFGDGDISMHFQGFPVINLPIKTKNPGGLWGTVS